jgi:hypothetical protein
MTQQSQNQALRLRDLAVTIVTCKGTCIAPDRYSSQDGQNGQLRIEYCCGQPHTNDVFRRGDGELHVFSVIWKADVGGDAVTVIYHGGVWEQALRRVAGTTGVISVA